MTTKMLMLVEQQGRRLGEAIRKKMFVDVEILGAQMQYSEPFCRFCRRTYKRWGWLARHLARKESAQYEA